MLNKTTNVAACLCLSIAGHCFAMENAKPSIYDSRLKTVAYNRNDTVRLDAVVGLTTHIEVGADEVYKTHAFGDPDAWELAYEDNHVFIKPRQANGDTNLTLITNKRVYHFLISYIGDYQAPGQNGNSVTKQIKTPWTLKQATIEIRFAYPGEEAEKRRAVAESNRIDKALSSSEFGHSVRNFNYQMSVDNTASSIAPINAWDNYHFTYFKFPENSELPTIFVIGADGKEATVNVRTIGASRNIIEAQMVASEWRIRYGKEKVIGVRNSGYDPTRGANSSGTVSQQVERVQKGIEEKEGQ